MLLVARHSRIYVPCLMLFMTGHCMPCECVLLVIIPQMFVSLGFRYETDVCIEVVKFLFLLRHQNILRVSCSKVEACHRVANAGWTSRAKPDCSKGKAPNKAEED